MESVFLMDDLPGLRQFISNKGIKNITPQVISEESQKWKIQIQGERNFENSVHKIAILMARLLIEIETIPKILFFRKFIKKKGKGFNVKDEEIYFENDKFLFFTTAVKSKERHDVKNILISKEQKDEEELNKYIEIYYKNFKDLDNIKELYHDKELWNKKMEDSLTIDKIFDTTTKETILGKYESVFNNPFTEALIEKYNEIRNVSVDELIDDLTSSRNYLQFNQTKILMKEKLEQLSIDLGIEQQKVVERATMSNLSQDDLSKAYYANSYSIHSTNGKKPLLDSFKDKIENMEQTLTDIERLRIKQRFYNPKKSFLYVKPIESRNFFQKTYNYDKVKFKSDDTTKEITSLAISLERKLFSEYNSYNKDAELKKLLSQLDIDKAMRKEIQDGLLFIIGSRENLKQYFNTVGSQHYSLKIRKWQKHDTDMYFDKNVDNIRQTLLILRRHISILKNDPDIRYTFDLSYIEKHKELSHLLEDHDYLIPVNDILNLHGSNKRPIPLCAIRDTYIRRWISFNDAYSYGWLFLVMELNHFLKHIQTKSEKLNKTADEIRKINNKSQHFVFLFLKQTIDFHKLLDSSLQMVKEKDAEKRSFELESKIDLFDMDELDETIDEDKMVVDADINKVSDDSYMLRKYEEEHGYDYEEYADNYYEGEQEEYDEEEY